MKKVLEDILKEHGKWSFKRTTALYVLNVAILYAFLPIYMLNFDVKEFVFWGFITYSGTMIGLGIKQKLAETAAENTNDTI